MGVEHFNKFMVVSIIVHSSEQIYIELSSFKSYGKPYPFKETIAPPAIDELIAEVLKLSNLNSTIFLSSSNCKKPKS